MSLLFKNAEGRLLFSSNSTHATHDGPTHAGTLVAVCELPGNLLAEGHHHVTIMLNGHQVTHAYEEDAVGFRVMDPGEGDTVRGDYSGEWGGYVRPMLPWAISPVGSTQSGGLVA